MIIRKSKDVLVQTEDCAIATATLHVRKATGILVDSKNVPFQKFFPIKNQYWNKEVIDSLVQYNLNWFSTLFRHGFEPFIMFEILQDFYPQTKHILTFQQRFPNNNSWGNRGYIQFSVQCNFRRFPAQFSSISHIVLNNLYGLQ